jgi:hypothetical protein
VPVAVHLVHKPTGKPVVQKRIDVVADGMAEMISPTRGQAPNQGSSLRASRANPDARTSLIQSNAMATALLLLPIGLGLLGFLEPGSIAATLIFIKHLEGQKDPLVSAASTGRRACGPRSTLQSKKRNHEARQ